MKKGTIIIITILVISIIAFTILLSKTIKASPGGTCSGISRSCRIFDPDECDLCGGCAWNPGSGRCDGTTQCSTYGEYECTTCACIWTETPDMKINIGDVWKDVDSIQINIGDSWKTVTQIKINIGDSWKAVYG